MRAKNLNMMNKRIFIFRIELRTLYNLYGSEPKKIRTIRGESFEKKYWTKKIVEFDAGSERIQTNFLDTC